MEKLTKSPRLNYLLGGMGIFNQYDVINHLPHRYDDYSYTDEKTITDKQKVVLLGKAISVPKVIPSKGVSVITFDIVKTKELQIHFIF